MIIILLWSQTGEGRRRTGRDQEILVNKKGRQFYQAYRYTTTTPRDLIYCSDHDKGSCAYEETMGDADWTLPRLDYQEKRWLIQWLELDRAESKTTERGKKVKAPQGGVQA